MKYINFNKISIQNFLSVGEEPVVVEFNRGLNIITGNNKDKVDRRNGVGKSTIADAINFAIFGSTLREVKKEHIINNINLRNCMVELYFTLNHDGNSTDYKIIRSLAPSKCYLYEDGIDKTRDSIANTTEYIQRLLNTTQDVFQNCVVMTINNATPFMAKKKLDKRKFIEGIFNLQVFSNMLNAARVKYNEVMKELDIECARYEEISNSIEAYNTQKSIAENEKHRARKKLQDRQSANNDEIEKLKNTKCPVTEKDLIIYTENMLKIDQTLPDINKKIQDIISRKGSINTSIKYTQSRLDKLGTDEKECPVCLSILDESNIDHINAETETLTTSLQEMNQQYKKCEDSLTNANTLLDTLTEKRRVISQKYNKGKLQLQELENINEKIKHLTSLNQDITDDLKSLDKKDNNFDKLIKDTELRLDEVQKVIDSVKKEMAKLDIIKFIVSEEGVKSYIVKKILQLFNAKLALYLKKMDSNCICIFNEYFEEEIINEKGKPCSYFNFSGAERKNIDLACLFAFMDIRRLQGDVAFNFSIYDELFDSSLDERGVELVVDILNERIEKFNECIMVISHRKESTKLATGEIIFLEKVNGITTRVASGEESLK